MTVQEAEAILQHGGPNEKFEIEAGDLNIIPLTEQPDFETLRLISERAGTACLFTHDSGEENALA